MLGPAWLGSRQCSCNLNLPPGAPVIYALQSHSSPKQVEVSCVSPQPASHGFYRVMRVKFLFFSTISLRTIRTVPTSPPYFPTMK